MATPFLAQRMVSILFACSALLTGALQAQQSAVWPAPYANTAGEAVQETPFSPSPVSPTAWFPPEARSVTLFSAATLPFAANARIRGVAWRRDALYNVSYAANNGHLRLRIGTVPDAAHPETKFNYLWSEEPSMVFDNYFNIPASPFPSSGTAAFVAVVPFQSPWIYPGGDLAVDVSFLANGPGVWRRDAVQLGDVVHARAANLGPGCQASSGFYPLHWVDLKSAVPGGSMRIHLEGGPVRASAAAAMHLLGSDVPVFQGFPLPINLAIFGLPRGCQLRTEIIPLGAVWASDFSTLYSRAFTALPIPNDLAFLGRRLSGQWLVLDRGVASPVQAVVSSAEAWTIGSPVPAASAAVFYGRTIWSHGRSMHIYDSGGRIGPRNYVAITRFDY